MEVASTKTVTIKLGGKAFEHDELVLKMAGEMKQLTDRYRFVVVHGGGAEVSALTRRLGFEPVFRNGIRMTSPEEMDIVDMVLCGKMNKKLVRLFRRAGLESVGLSGSDGGIFSAHSIGTGTGAPTRTGTICGVNAKLLLVLLREGYVPTVSSTSMDDTGTALNVNADSVAFAVASELKCHILLFLSDIPGVIKNGHVMRDLSAQDAQEEIRQGTISGGMIPKVESALEALENGVHTVTIGEYAREGALADLLSGGNGTLIHHRTAKE